MSRERSELSQRPCRFEQAKLLLFQDSSYRDARLSYSYLQQSPERPAGVRREASANLPSLTELGATHLNDRPSSSLQRSRPLYRLTHVP